jgi:hypothetical protein
MTAGQRRRELGGPGVRRVYNLGILLVGIVATGWIFWTVGLVTLAANRALNANISNATSGVSLYFTLTLNAGWSPRGKADDLTKHEWVYYRS